MKTLLFAMLALFSFAAGAANFNCNFNPVQPNVQFLANCTYDPGTTVAPPVQPPVQPPVVPPQPANCDTSQTRVAINAREITIAPGSVHAYSFTAPKEYGGLAKMQYPTSVFTMTISANACDMSAALDPASRCKVVGGTAPGIYYTPYDPRMCVLTPGETYYLNVRPGTPDGHGGWQYDCDSSQNCKYWIY